MREKSHRNKIRKALMKFMLIIELDPLADGWASGYYIAEKLADHIKQSYTSHFNTLIASILYEEVTKCHLEFQERGGPMAADHAACLYRLPNALERLAQL